MVRSVCSYTGYTHDELYQNKSQARSQFLQIAPNITMVDRVDASIEWLNVYCEHKKPDILIIDQLDKVNVNGTFRTDESFSIYTKFKRYAKGTSFLVLVLVKHLLMQRRTHVTYAMMENSKTGKAAEADPIIGIGKNDITNNDDTRRYLTISKNKLSGFHGNIVCNLDTKRNRYTV